MIRTRTHIYYTYNMRYIYIYTRTHAYITFYDISLHCIAIQFITLQYVQCITCHLFVRRYLRKYVACSRSST